jgi:chemotaxis protein MotB
MKRKPRTVRRHTSAGPSAPLWIITYSDMVTLLLGFFILLAGLSELKRPEQFEGAVNGIKNSFRIPIPGVTAAQAAPSPVGPTFAEQVRSMHVPLATPAEEEAQESALAAGVIAGAAGNAGGEAAVLRVHEGYLFTRGGRITFEPGSADLTDEARRSLAQIASWLRGCNNRIEILGYAAAMESATQPAGDAAAQGSDLWSLSYARAKAVMDVLTAPESPGAAVRPEQVRLIANGDHEPRVRRVYGSKGQEPNRRVEILVTDTLVEETRQPEGVAK